MRGHFEEKQHNVITGALAQPDLSLDSDSVIEWHVTNHLTFLGLSFHISKLKPIESILSDNDGKVSTPGSGTQKVLTKCDFLFFRNKCFSKSLGQTAHYLPEASLTISFQIPSYFELLQHLKAR